MYVDSGREQFSHFHTNKIFVRSIPTFDVVVLTTDVLVLVKKGETVFVKDLDFIYKKKPSRLNQSI